MLQKVVVVVPRLQFKEPGTDLKCPFCASSKPALPLCGACNHLQDVPENLTYFEALGIPSSLKVNLADLQKNYHDLSRVTHPDRYVLKSGLEPIFATRWSSLINKAYQALRDPRSRAGYLLEISGRSSSQASPPLDLAELYFDIQDKLGSAEGQAVLSSFKTQIEQEQRKLADEWKRLEETWVENSTPHLEALQKLFQADKYLASMLNDIEKKGGGFAPNTGN